MSYRVGPPPPPWARTIVLDFVASAAGAGVLLVGGACFLAQYESPVKGGRPLVAAMLWAPLMLGTSLGVLVHDLGRRRRFWRMLSTLNPRSVMSWGAWLLNALFAAACGGFAIWLAPAFGLLPMSGWQERFRLLSLAFVVLAPLVLAYKGMLLGTTAVPLWRTGRLFGPLLLADGISLGAALLALGALFVPAALGPLGAFPLIERAMRGGALLRGGLMVAILWQAGADRRLLMRDPIRSFYFSALILSLAAVPVAPAIASPMTIVVSILLRTALVRAPYVGTTA